MMWWFHRKGPSGFSGASTAEEVTAGVDGQGLVAVITGASSGMGLETARVLALRGVHVVMAVRNVAAGLAVKESIVAKIPGARVDVLELDLSSMASVRRFASEFDSLNLPVNILILYWYQIKTPSPRPSQSAVVQICRLCLMWWFYRKGPSGFSVASTAEEVTAGVNGRGLVAVITGASSGIGLETARVLALRGVHVIMAVRNVSAGLAAKEAIVAKIPGATVDVLELDLSFMASVRRFASEFSSLNLPLNILILNDFISYGQSKLANILHSNELSRILKEEGVNISANAVHPGAIATKLFRNRTIVSALLNSIGRIICKSVEQGAATTCYVAMHRQMKAISGKYFTNCNITCPSSQALDAELAKKLWQFSLQTVSS
ncbi:Short-chain dehydrogenase TIC 32, chloroplastic [Dichanthelium oligosanthes]|uniref:Short-chain dehydrogenase TIC 32, chloroplastic n=1 Tax=Dichanthelium oligosanthes TaxID=888268 RepID=A0A1E5ULK7_9POAL|nr:Short-chain dehydrogenase TIC 32, chloroplastic [Dichanthelium oligosanthes]